MMKRARQRRLAKRANKKARVTATTTMTARKTTCRWRRWKKA
jgi:hypothetical protein